VNVLRVYYNIETLPQKGVNWTSFVDKVEIGNRTVQATIDRWRAEQAPRLYRATAKDPFLANQFIATFLVEDDEEPTMLLEEEGDERKLYANIERIHEELEKGERVCWHTWNGLNFDHPLTLLRALRYGCTLTAKQHQTAKWGDAHHVDWFLKLNVRTESGGWPRGKLDEVASFLGIHYPNPFTGEYMSRAFDAGDFDGIRAHARSRVFILRDIARRFEGVTTP
jgi:hypothetical protein